jgi:hypothetical protein
VGTVKGSDFSRDPIIYAKGEEGAKVIEKPRF